MSDSIFDRETLYGIPVPEKARAGAARTLKKYQRKYGADDKAEYRLSTRDNETLGPVFNLKTIQANVAGEAVPYDRAVFIGTIRMGYGHYRIGMALASAANALGYVPCWLDLLGFDSAGARMIRDLDKWYSLGSRISQQSKLFNNLLWDPLFGKWYKPLAKNYAVMGAAALFADVHRDIPPETPFLATHPFNANGAMFAGLNRVVNVVPDNCPLGFHVAPGALHTVQSPSAYCIFRTLRGLGQPMPGDQAMPAEELHLAGHYVDHELASNAVADCAARLARMDAGEPRRLLFSIGGAGAQQQLLAGMLEHLLPLIQSGKVAVLLNCGDHRKVLDLFNARIAGFSGLARHYGTWEDTCRFVENAGSQSLSGLHVFLHENPYQAVYTTNMLMRVADVLVTKPSELAFYPIPKLLLERVGGHEAWGAIRAAELGDGTPECAGLPCTLQTLALLLREKDLLRLFCDQICRMSAAGVYDGAYRAVRLAVTGAME